MNLNGEEFGRARTHEPLLLATLLVAPSGPVLELGAGYGSTITLHAVCAAARRRLVTVEGQPAWAEQFRSLETADHRILSVNGDWTKIPVEDWAVVFVDHAPAEQRVVDIEQLADRCELMVVHDTEDAVYGYEPLLSRFRYRYDYQRMRPWTTVVSNRREVPRDL